MKLRECALNFLARREHSRHELKQKLTLKGYGSNQIESELLTLAQEGLQSDARFAEAYVRVRVEAGFGPRRISMELRQRGVSDSLIHDHLSQDPAFWWEALLSVWRKKYDRGQAIGPKAYAKAARFLTQRGFDPEQIHRLLRDRDGVVA